MDCLVSIIIPVYNAEIFLDDCLKSVTNQTYKKIEIIIVIDGATDSSADIAKKWAIKDNRIVYCWQTNMGSGAARNKGISLSHGKYLVFVDPDDEIDCDMIYAFVVNMEKTNADLLLSGCETYGLNEDLTMSWNEIEKYPYEEISGIDIVRNRYLQLFNVGAIRGPTEKMYRRSIIIQNNVQFPSFKRSQDVVFNYRYYSLVKSIVIDDGAYYKYRTFVNNYYVKKIPSDFYITISTIFGDVSKLLFNWGVTLKNNIEFAKFCNYYFSVLCFSIRTGKCSDYTSKMVCDKNIRKLVKKAEAKTKMQFLLKSLIIMRFGLLINVLIKIINRKKGDV